ncbi:MAG: tetraacyldisaccharide 4'-kinase [SAR86 cluster bacterium]|uniref:Tetraacyldisaccharide 4'-kinase n=1 Tax=SAR86 cluster bacterium TaxID=2030880 RepID=A0A2A4MDD3_9GAMM|nr:MAG: tetraacyldisaccharide 4'-kinase [SAR86 cluster bacterium]
MSYLEQAWDRKAPWLILLWPLSLLFMLLAGLRKNFISHGAKTPVPVIVVGNISVGGTGKTPLVLALAAQLKAAGFNPGIVSRGYGSKAPYYPFKVAADSKVDEVGDEALLIVQNSGCPMFIGADRPAALAALLIDSQCDLVISDDGMQHYALARDIEIAVVDAQRLFSNGFCLPAGPLRERVSRLKTVDHIMINGELAQPLETIEVLKNAASLSSMQMKPSYFINLKTGERKPFGGAPFNIGTKLQAVTGIGNPQRFFDLLAKLPYQLETNVFPDHHRFTLQDFENEAIDASQPVVMTEKDAVKCQTFARSNFWYLQAKAHVDSEFLQRITEQVENLLKANQASK